MSPPSPGVPSTSREPSHSGLDKSPTLKVQKSAIKFSGSVSQATSVVSVHSHSSRLNVQVPVSKAPSHSQELLESQDLETERSATNLGGQAATIAGSTEMAASNPDIVVAGERESEFHEQSKDMSAHIDNLDGNHENEITAVSFH